ncbi:MAG: ACP phosphodiesterase [Gemmatimonadota bacterium]|nr:MAG: ACP phosphodiesterase [Gemmatimonadota bacterium]
MNHLAHALVAHRTGTSLVGNLMGDFVKGSPREQYQGELLEGILLHRAVDAFTDSHPAFLRCRRRFRPPYRRWAGVLVDIFWDHVLAREWDRYGTGSLPEFAAGVYRELADHPDPLPGHMAGFVEYMTRHDLLVAYASRQGIAQALGGLSRRVRRPNPLGEGILELDRIGADVAADLDEFLPDLLRQVAAGRPDPGGEDEEETR